MGVYIKGMKMPESCSECLNELMFNIAFDCNLNDIEDGKRLPSCPLVEVPPHGRLIDIDALFKQNHYDYIDALEIDESPVVIQPSS